jgi:probable HAF family extracellular repeat protein
MDNFVNTSTNTNDLSLLSNSNEIALLPNTASTDPIKTLTTSSGGGGSIPIAYGPGDDVIEHLLGNFIINTGNGYNIVTTGSGQDVIFGGSGIDIINAGDGKNQVLGGNGDNRILTGAGADTVTGGTGNDIIYTGAGADVITTGNGNNLVSSGSGADSITLGSGKDKIILDRTSSATVIGFDTTQDKLYLGSGVLSSTVSFVASGADTLVKAGQKVIATLKDVVANSSVLGTAPLFTYTATDLGEISSTGNSTQATVINDKGEVAGRASTGLPLPPPNLTGIANQGFIWKNGVLTPLTLTGKKVGDSTIGGAMDGQTVVMPGRGGLVNGMNDVGTIVGAADELPGSTDRATLWQKKGANHKLTVYEFGGVESYFFDTNNSKEMAGRHIYGPGSAGTPPNRSNAIMWKDGVQTDLPDLNGDTGTARSINAKGDIVGVIDGDGALNDITVNNAVMWKKNADGSYTLTNLGTGGAEQSSARDINELGQIVGSTSNGTGTTATSNAVIWQNGTLTNLPSLGGSRSDTNGINNFGQIVGFSQNVGAVSNAVVWTNGVVSNLNSLVTNPTTLAVNGAPVTLSNATGINNFGNIIAQGTYTYTDNSTGTPTVRTGTRSYLLQVNL